MDRLNEEPETSIHKAFDRESYTLEMGIKNLKRHELIEMLVVEANIRHNVQCDLEDERFNVQNLKNALNKVRAERRKWHTVASGLRQVVNNLMGY